MFKNTSLSLILYGVLIVLFVLPVLGETLDDARAPRADYLSGTRGNTLQVGSGQTYSTIQAAVDDASNGDTVFVHAGTYEESIILKDGIKLIGETPDRPVIDCDNIFAVNPDVVAITAANDVTIEGFHIRKAESAIEAHNCSNLYISRNIIKHMDWAGVYLWGYANAVITNNIFYNSSMANYYTLFSSDPTSYITIANNVFDRCDRGTFTNFGVKTIVNNIFSDSDVAVNFPSANGTYVSNNIFWKIMMNYSTPTWKNNMIVDPQFTNGSYSISWDSPAIDAGTTYYATIVDFAGNSRPVDADGDGILEIDIGAYEITRTVQDFYVDASSPSGGTGSSAKPFNRITDAIENATSGDTIYVSSGNYEEKIRLKDGMRLIGEMPNRPVINGTNVSPGSLGRTMIIPNHDVLIEGFIITGGDRGIVNYGYKNVSISRNILIDLNWTGIENQESSESVISNNQFINLDDGIRPIMGSWMMYVPPYDIISNNVFDGCRYGIASSDGIQTIINNIFVNCNYALSRCDDPETNISTNIFWNNNNDFYITPEGHNNITENPQFIDSSYHINWSSPAVDAGTPVYIPARDFDGEFRAFDGDSDGSEEVDIGIDEKVKNTIYVDAGSPAGGNGTILRPFNSIQEAIDNADPGYMIRVSSGTYQEIISVNKTLTLIGEDYGTTIIDGSGISGPTDSVVTITADWVNISGFKITGSGAQEPAAGILILGNYSTIKNCDLSENNYGIHIDDSSYNSITICIINSNAADGLFLSGSSNGNIVRNNTFVVNQGYGINIGTDSTFNSIFYNNFIDNLLDLVSTDKTQSNDDGQYNSWNISNEGNYWHDYTQPDDDNDGIVDVPYNISGSANALDYYPLRNLTVKLDIKLIKIISPTIKYSSVGANTTDFPVKDAEIDITFSKSMDFSSLEKAISISPPADFSLNLSENDTHLRIEFTEDLAYNTTYSLRINTTAKDHDNVHLRAELMLQITTREKTDIEKPTKPTGALLDNFVIFGILIVGLLIIIIAISIRIYRRRKKEVLEKEATELETRLELPKGKLAEEYEFPGGVQAYADDFILNLANEALEIKKPSDFGPPSSKILKSIEQKYRSGEISKTTYELVRSDLFAHASKTD
jgi:parallel beta-helix repeat protein